MKRGMTLPEASAALSTSYEKHCALQHHAFCVSFTAGDTGLFLLSQRNAVPRWQSILLVDAIFLR